MHELCRVRSGNYDCFNWKQALFGERIPKKYGKAIKIWHLLRDILCGPFGSNGMTRYLTKLNGMRRGLNNKFEMKSSSTAKLSGNG